MDDAVAGMKAGGEMADVEEWHINAAEFGRSAEKCKASDGEMISSQSRSVSEISASS